MSQVPQLTEPHLSRLLPMRCAEARFCAFAECGAAPNAIYARYATFLLAPIESSHARFAVLLLSPAIRLRRSEYSVA